MEWSHVGLLVLVGVAGGMFGATMGVGGGAFIVPLLTLVLGLPVHVAIASSLVAVAGTACASAASYIRAGFTNVRLGLVLETTTTAGAVAGALLAAWLDARWLLGLFGMALAYTGISMVRHRNDEHGGAGQTAAGPPGLASSLGGSYFDGFAGQRVEYGVRRLRLGLAASSGGGMLSGLLGIGGGIVKVPVMNLAMGLPMKAAVGTSSFMIGITAAASSFVYYQRGYMDPMVAAPVLAGVFLGSQAGVMIVKRARAQGLKAAFAAVLLAMSGLMLFRAAGVAV